MNPYAALCDEFYLACYLNTEMELPQTRDTVLHFFEQVRKAFPKMTNFYGRDPNEFVLEEESTGIKVLTANLPGTATSVTVPAAFLKTNTAYKFEVMVREATGNQTSSEVAFRTSN